MALYWLLISLGLVITSLAQTGPNFCSYLDGTFECDYASMVSSSDRPIDFTGFSVQPQMLEVKVNGFFPFFGDSQVFSSDFGGIDKNLFDPNYPATLTIDCGFGGSMFMTAGAFVNMSYVQHLKIRNCMTFYIPAMMFEELESLDYFSFEGGVVDDMNPNGMFGVSVEKMTFDSHAIPRHLGRFEVMYTGFAAKYVPPGLLFNWKNLSTVALVGADIETISSDVFTFNLRLCRIDISDNSFTSIPAGIFSNLNSLSEVTIKNVEWTCTCSNAWFVDFADSNNITMLGDYMCSNIAGTSVWKYWYDTCSEKNLCEGTIGIVLLKKCLTLFAMLAYGCAFVALVLCIVCLILIILARKQMLQQNTRRAKAKGRWNKVMDLGIKMAKTKK